MIFYCLTSASALALIGSKFMQYVVNIHRLTSILKKIYQNRTRIAVSVDFCPKNKVFFPPCGVAATATKEGERRKRERERERERDRESGRGRGGTDCSAFLRRKDVKLSCGRYVFVSWPAPILDSQHASGAVSSRPRCSATSVHETTRLEWNASDFCRSDLGQPV